MSLNGKFHLPGKCKDCALASKQIDITVNEPDYKNIHRIVGGDVPESLD